MQVVTIRARHFSALDLFAGVKILDVFDVKAGGRLICGSTCTRVYMVIYVLFLCC